MSRKILCVFSLLLCINVTTCENALPNTSLLDFHQYANDVLDQLMWDLEEAGISNLRMLDFTQYINESLYGFQVIGDLKYSGGFVTGIKGFSIKLDSTNSIMSNTMLTTAVKSTFVLEGVKFCYDVVADLKDGIHIATGITRLTSIDYVVVIEKDLSTNFIVSNMTKAAITNTKHSRMLFLPENDYTTVFSRKFNTLIPDVSKSFEEWGTGFLGELLDKITKEKINFPKIDYDTLV